MNNQTLDVHGLKSVEALLALKKLHQRLVDTGFRGRLLVVHGYGSGGTGGVLRTKLRKWMDEEQIEYLCGELAGGNPGTSIVRFQ